MQVRTVGFQHWQGQDLADYPNIRRWFDAVAERPCVKKGAAVGEDFVDRSVEMPDEEKKLLFGLRD